MIKAFKVTINWYGESHVHWSSTTSKNAALQNAMRRLSNKFNINLTTVRAKVLGNPNSHLTEEG